jgi:hypothetical protein
MNDDQVLREYRRPDLSGIRVSTVGSQYGVTQFDAQGVVVDYRLYFGRATAESAYNQTMLIWVPEDKETLKHAHLTTASPSVTELVAALQELMWAADAMGSVTTRVYDAIVEARALLARCK